MKARAKILPPSIENLRVVADALKTGEVIGLPTETVYGLAGDALNPEALSRIFDTKERPTFDPLIVHVSMTALAGRLRGLENLGLVDSSRLSPLATERAEALMLKFWPGPLTLVLPKLAKVPDLATAGLPTVAIRMPRHPVAQALLAMTGIPLAAPSANRFGRISPTTAQHVLEELGDRIDWILEGGPCEIGLESTVVSVAETGELSLLRPGGISSLEIEALTGTRLKQGASGEAQAIAQGHSPAPGPGMLESHYAPKKPLFLLSGSLPALTEAEPALRAALAEKPRKLGILAFSGNALDAEKSLSELTALPVIARSLSSKGDPVEAAKNLFAWMRELDRSDADVLLAEPCPIEHGVGYAISDRLKRASRR